MSDQSTEGERKLRAIVRALLSSGVWVLVAIHVASALPVRLGWFGEVSAEVPWPRAFWSGFLLAAVLYAEAGLYTMLARTREAVSASEVFRASAPVFSRFLWLILKTAGFFMLILLTVAIFASMALSILGYGDAEAIKPLMEGPFRLVLLVLPALLIWWLPRVFSRQDFSLFSTLKAAIRHLWREPARTLYVILLALAPAALLLVWAEQLNLWVLTALEAFGLLCVWSANIYCVEWWRDHPTV